MIITQAGPANMLEKYCKILNTELNLQIDKQFKQQLIDTMWYDIYPSLDTLQHNIKNIYFGS